MSFIRPLLAATILTGLGGGMASAEEQTPGTFLDYMAKNSVTLTSIGNDGGIEGYMAKSSNNREQTLYVMPDGKHAVVGVMVSATGENITGKQIAAMVQRLEDAKRQLHDASASSSTLASTVTALPGASLPDAPANDAISAATTPAATAPDVAESKDVSAYKSSVDKDKFLKEADNTAWFDVARDAKVTNTVYMVADPQCPFCHKAWSKLKPLVNAGKIRVRVILIAGLPGSDKLVPRLMTESNVAGAWMHGQGSEDNVTITGGSNPGSKLWAAASDYARKNADFASHYMKAGTPLMAYVGGDGQLYMAEGPNDVVGFLSGML